MLTPTGVVATNDTHAPLSAERVVELDLASVLNSMAIAVWVVDAAGTIVFANETGLMFHRASSLEELQASGPDSSHLRGVRTEDGTPIPERLMPFNRALAGESVIRVMEVFDHETRGTVVLRTRTTPIRDHAGTIVGAVKIAIDITKEYELASVRDEFIRQAAHELKTPITLIKANAELLTAREQPAPAQLGALIRGVDRIDGIVNSLLDLIDLQGGIFSFSRMPVPLDRVIDGALARLPASVARRVQVSAAPVVVNGDEARLRRVIYALIDNAAKYSPPTEAVGVSVTRENGVAHISVRDHGYGIPEHLQSRVFEKYFRAHAGTERDAGGIGVGLFVAREIVRQHDGRMWFESRENQGTVFHVTMPVHAEAT